jgi:hypothetical protein
MLRHAKMQNYDFNKGISEMGESSKGKSSASGASIAIKRYIVSLREVLGSLKIIDQ